MAVYMNNLTSITGSCVYCKDACVFWKHINGNQVLQERTKTIQSPLYYNHSNFQSSPATVVSTSMVSTKIFEFKLGLKDAHTITHFAEPVVFIAYFNRTQVLLYILRGTWRENFKHDFLTAEVKWRCQDSRGIWSFELPPSLGLRSTAVCPLRFSASKDLY